MEHFQNPFEAGTLSSARAVENRRFFDEVLSGARSHRFFSHPFMAAFAQASSRELASFVLTTFYQVVSPFTGLLCALGARAPNLASRFALMDNIYEEMGRGDLACAHPNLYLRMLSSMGVDAAAAERVPVLPAIARINDHLREVVERRHFSVACAVLASAEATIPPSFPALARGARNAFQDIDLSFFDRHGPRDEGHSGDAATLFALTGDSSQFGTVEREVTLDLEHRSELFDDWAAHLGHETLASRPARAGRAQPGG
jgi:pyrroloquinoline quinone (PQQ) biosynthesis protein C